MMEQLATSPVVRAVGLALLHFLWQGALLAAVAAGLFYVLRRASASVRYIAGCGVLIAMVAAPVATLLWLMPTATSSAAVVAPVVLPGSVAFTSTLPTLPETTPMASPTPVAPGVMTRAVPFVAVLWAFGVGTLTLHLAGSWLLVQRLRRRSAPVDVAWRARVDALAGRLGIRRTVGLAQSAAVDVPTLVGWLRPVILMPASVLAGLPPTQLDAVLMHELAHVRRHDYLVNLLQSVAETLLFYHPAVWWVSRRVRIERELCCDDVAVDVCGDRVTYAHALVSLEELRGGTPALALAATDGDLVGRIRRLLGAPAVDAPRSSAWSVLLVMLVAVPIAAIAATGQTDDSPDQTSTDIQLEVQAPLAPPPVVEGVSVRPRIVTDGPDEDLEITTAPASPVALQSAQPVPVALNSLNRSLEAVFSERAGRQIQTPTDATADEAAVLALEEQFRVAKVEADLAALDRLYDAAVVTTNQNGNKRNKAGQLELWTDFRIQVLTLDEADVQVVGDLATVTGRQTEVGATGTDRLLFTRVWRRSGDTWTLVSVSQFRDPQSRPIPTPFQTHQNGFAARLQWELFKNDALLGRPLITMTTFGPGSVTLPDGSTIRLTLAGVDGEDVSIDMMHSRPNGPRVVTPRSVLKEDEPGQLAWTFEENDYRLSLTVLSVDEMQQVTGGISSVHW